MKVNNPLKKSSIRNIELLLENYDEFVWEALEKHNKTYNDNLVLVYDPYTYDLILK